MSDILVVYYSFTGNSKKVAEYVKEKLKADILELEPEVAFSTDYDEVVDLGQDEVNNNTLREIEDININLDNYDTIILATLSSG